MYLLDSKIHISGCRYEKILKFGEEKVDISSFQTQLESPQSDFYRGRYDVFNLTLETGKPNTWQTSKGFYMGNWACPETCPIIPERG